MLYVCHVVVQGQSVLNAEHNALAPLPLVFVQVAGGAGNTDIPTVVAHNLLDLVEDQVGIGHRTVHVEGYDL